MAVLPSAPSQAAVFDPPGSEYTRTAWTARDGLPSTRIGAIAQDGNGFLWLATSAGLTRFDGKRFELGGALDDRVRLPIATLALTRDGSVWFAFTTSARVGRLQGRDLAVHDGLPGPVVALMQSRDGTLWAGGDGGLSVYRDHRWERIDSGLLGPETAVDALFEDRQGNIWIGTSEGVYRRRADTGSLDFVRRIPSPIAHKFAQTGAGDVVVNDPQYTLASLTRTDTLERKVADLGLGRAFHVLHDRQGSLWVATAQGLARIADYPRGRVERVSPDTNITSLFEDRDQNIWMGTADGLVRLSRARIASFAGGNSAAAPLGKVVAAATDGSVWAATGDGVVRFSAGKQTFFGTRDGLPSGSVSALHGGRDGAVWLGTDKGLTRHLNGRFESFPLPGTSPRHAVRSITTDREGGLWVVDLQGLFRWKDGTVTPVDFLQKPAYTVRVISADARGRLWIGLTEGEVGVYEAGQLRWYSERDGLAPAPVLAIAEDSRGVVWVATTAGISRFENDRFSTLKQGIPGNVLIGLAIDRHDYLWIAVNSGIVRLSQKEFDKAVKDPFYPIQPLVYDASDGLVGTPRYDGGNPNAVRASDGTLWFTTTHGLAVADPARLHENRPPPPVVIEAASADRREFEPGLSARLPAGTSVVEVHYTAPAVSADTKVRFRHRLEGFDRTWMLDEDPNRRVLYTNLFPGTYRLRIGASYGDGMWSQPEAIWEFSVAPRFYQTRSFYAICVIAVALAVWTAWQVRLRGVRRQFSMVLSERARVGREIHDTLLQSLVGMALQLDNIATELGSSSHSAKQQLERLRRQVERCVGEANQSIWNLRSPMPEKRDFPSVLREHAESIIASTGTDFQFAANARGPACAPDVEQQLLRIAQEAVMNAIRHGRPMRIRMELFYETDAVRLCISDDGCGFDTRAVSRNGGRHWGLTIMQERAQQIGGRFNINSVPNEGTTVEVVAPSSDRSAVRGDDEVSNPNLVRG